LSIGLGKLATDKTAQMQKSGQQVLTKGQANILSDLTGEDFTKVASEAKLSQARLATFNNVAGKIGTGLALFAVADNVIKRTNSDITQKELGINLAKIGAPIVVGVFSGPGGWLTGGAILIDDFARSYVAPQAKQFVEKRMSTQGDAANVISGGLFKQFTLNIMGQQ